MHKSAWRVDIPAPVSLHTLIACFHCSVGNTTNEKFAHFSSPETNIDSRGRKNRTVCTNELPSGPDCFSSAAQRSATRIEGKTMQETASSLIPNRSRTRETSSRTGLLIKNLYCWMNMLAFDLFSDLSGFVICTSDSSIQHCQQQS